MKTISAATAAAVLSSVSVATAANNSNPFAPKTTRKDRQTSYLGSLLAKAVPTANSRRRLDDAAYDISSYSIKFEKCQYVKQFAEERDEDIDTVLETQRFVIFRLCPNNSCSSSCNSNYGEYLIDMESYLEATLKHKEEEQEKYCQTCDECAADDDAANEDVNDDAAARRKRRLSYSVDCSTCYSQCQNIANMEENGYVDAAEYVSCGKVYENENTGKVYYAGAICANSGSRIKVGLFTDKKCNEYDADAEVDKYIKNENGYNVKLSYHLLKQTFVADECVASCAKVDDNADQEAAVDDDVAAANNDDANAAQQQNVETAEVCENLYEASGKCESPHGMAYGIDYSNSDYYDVQLANEEAVCDYISNIQSGQYDQYGDVIVVRGGGGGSRSSVVARSVQTTGGQKFALTFFVIGSVGLAAYAALLNQKIKGSRAALSKQDAGVMA